MKDYDNNDDSFYVQMDELDKKLVKDNAKLKLEEITTNKINEINEMNKKMENIMKTSNSDLQNIYNNIINKNNEKIKQIRDIYHDINLSHDKKIYYIGHIVNGSHVINTTARYINNSDGDSANKKGKNGGGKKS